MPWHDIAVMVRGPAVNDLSRHFVQYWSFATLELKLGHSVVKYGGVNKRNKMETFDQVARVRQDVGQFVGKFVKQFSRKSKDKEQKQEGQASIPIQPLSGVE